MKVSSALLAVVGLAVLGVATEASAARDSAAQKYAKKRASALVSKYSVPAKGASELTVTKTDVAVSPVVYEEETTKLYAKPVSIASNSVFKFSSSATAARNNTPATPSSAYNYSAAPGVDGTDGFSLSNPPGPTDRPSVFSNWVWSGTGWVWGGLPCSNGGSGGISPC